MVLARLDEQKAQDAIRVAKDPFVPKVYAGSGLAKVWGYPTSIEGAAPSIVQSRTDMALFNRPKSFELARMRETARGAAIGTQSKSDEVAYETAVQFLDIQQLARSAQSLDLELQSLQRASASVNLRMQEGRELPLEAKRVAVDLARGRQRAEALRDDLDYAEAALAVVLGYPAGDRVQPGRGRAPGSPKFPRASRPRAKWLSKTMRKSGAWNPSFRPKASSCANTRPTGCRWSMSWRNTLSSRKAITRRFLTEVQRNNGELGVSIQIPLLTGSATKGMASQAQIEIMELRTQMNQTRNRIELDTQKSYQELQKALSASEVARLDLDYAQGAGLSAARQLGEGRVPQQKVDDARFNEQEKWIAFYDAQAHRREEPGWICCAKRERCWRRSAEPDQSRKRLTRAAAGLLFPRPRAAASIQLRRRARSAPPESRWSDNARHRLRPEM